MIEYLAETTAILVTCVAVRMIPVFLWKTNPTDAWSHFYLAGLIRSSGEVPDKFNKVIPETEVSYPWGLGLLFSMFPSEDPVRRGSIVNVMLLAINAGVAAIVAFEFSTRLLGQYSIDPGVSALLACGMFVFLPYDFSTFSSTYNISARPIGLVLTNLTVLSLVLGEVATWQFYLVPLLLIPMQLYVSKFAIQASILAGLFLALVFQSLLPVLTVVAGLLAAIIVFRKNALRIMMGMWYHSLFYYQYLQDHAVNTAIRTWSLRKWVGQVLRGGGLKKAIAKAYFTPSIRVFVFFPWLFLLLYGLITMPGIFRDDLLGPLAGLCGFALILVPVFVYRRFRFLGEADRYLSFIALTPLAILVSVLVQVLPNGFVMYAVISVVSAVSVAGMILGRPAGGGGKDDGAADEVIGWLNSQPNATEAVVLISPTNLLQRFLEPLKGTLAGLFFNAPFSDEGRSYLARLYPGFYPYPCTELDRLRDEFGIDFLVVSKHYYDETYLRRHDIPRESITIPDREPEFQNGSFMIFHTVVGQRERVR